MSRGEVAEAYAAAAARKRQDRTNTYTSYTEEELRAKLEGRTLKKVSMYSPPFRPPESEAEWWDDRIIAHGSALGGGGFPEAPVLVAVAVAAREGGADAAVKAVRAARQLEPRVQWGAYQNLLIWKSNDLALRCFGADWVVGRVLAEWSRLRLPEADPEADPEAERTPRRRRRPWEITAAEAS